ncbi:dipeptidase PepE [Shewanella atlantica]|uniref:Peptidase E n=1 Tax=Shewanella atlantica TaxID=271099 RepID=A0A431W9M0_9GAMM|nr:dipeptidase PepE [Shewanella atlantica]RTR32182.1 dipeptidase PepE [Shewanella atlantica]
MSINALLLSSSRVGDTPYLAHAIPFIKPLIAELANRIKPQNQKWLFIPYAGVSISHDAYLTRVISSLAELDIEISGIHQYDDPRQAIVQADGILVGGGNTFNLLHKLYKHDLVKLLTSKVSEGTPYIGWSAGSNIAGLSIRTTNDMPIVEPSSFNSLGLLPFQLNPHYTNYQAPGHNGETRAQRLLEFTCVDPDTPIVAIQEGTALWRQGDKLSLIGDKQAYLFCGLQQEIPIPVGSELSHLLIPHSESE